MRKVKPFLILLLSVVFVSFLVVNSYARQLTPSERSKYAQNNIIFYVPGEGSSSTENGTSAGANKIVDFAMKSSWPDENGMCKDNDNAGTLVNWSLDGVTPNPFGCRHTINDFARSYNKTVGELRDCGRFVGFVLQNTVDPSAASGGTVSQSKHMDAHPEMWTKVSKPGEELPMSNLQPGDILVYSGGTGAASGHIMIYIGDHEVNCGGGSKCTVNIAEASTNLDNDGHADPNGGRTPFMRKITTTLYGRNKSTPYNVYRYTADIGSSGSSEGGSGSETVQSGPDGINISKEVFKPCTSDKVQQTSHTGNTYSYSYGGTTYTVANTKLDLASYLKYLEKRKIKQDGQTCDPLTNKCYNNTSAQCENDDYCDYGYCLMFAMVFAGNLSQGNCTATDYGAGHSAGAASQANPTYNMNKNDKLTTLQAIYDFIMQGRVAVVKVASYTTVGTSRHFVVAVGVKAGVSRSNLTERSFLYLDPSRYLTTERDLFYQACDKEGCGYWVKEA